MVDHSKKGVKTRSETIHEGKKYNWMPNDIRLEGVIIEKETDKAMLISWKESVKQLRRGSIKLGSSKAWFPKSVINIIRFIDEFMEIDDIQAYIPSWTWDKLFKERQEYGEQQKEERMANVRVVWHYIVDGNTYCGQKPKTSGWTMDHTKDKALVTCKKCLKKLGR